MYQDFQASAAFPKFTISKFSHFFSNLSSIFLFFFFFFFFFFLLLLTYPLPGKPAK
ncbi:hypothetical protein M431DRAFT_251603 [Trichoderma harzianum CBS 226.95]|uniref:Uncharacterized protein n=1 Tax=Trichoderma harzianum CBS 226.95 TaxID=983964 RepID=A0A2T4A048_TRIHA|nr:hypothetical protein M431DRAFT_251603 [Trichoderma harzianum CBS 226.95]PTB50373.1 hypothetical protein M431DRAFT_251603 [Trichoderma harzianum CBS 226.95]